MKVTTSALVGLLALGAQSLSIQQPDQTSFSINKDSQISAAANQVAQFFNYRNVESFMKSVASGVGQKLDDIPSAAIEAWTEVLGRFPESIDQLTFETTREFLSSKAPKSQKGKPRNDWEDIVEKTDLPGYKLKVKTPGDLGVDNTKQYSGYLDVNDDAHLFYWFFESRNDPENDPVIIWLNGGPGCSSLTGLFFELGPASIDENLKPVHNPWSWNNNASVIFLDQPVGTGFSYGGDSVSTTPKASKHFHAFVKLFMDKFPQYSHQKRALAGESYGGHYVPVFANELVNEGVKLDTILVGNGLTHPQVQYRYYEPFVCDENKILDDDACQGMKNSEDRCISLIDSCYDTESAWTCVPATIYCNNAMMGPYQQTGLNVYDIRKPCENDNLCYADLPYIEQYLNKPEVKTALGAEVENYQGCNFDVNRNFMFAGDWMKPYYTAVESLLESDIPVLIYAGDKDFICNYLGNQKWTEAEPFGLSPETKPWLVNGEQAGTVQNRDQFTFLRVYDAGHMVPYDQGENCLNMVNSWLAGDYSFSGSS